MISRHTASLYHKEYHYEVSEMNMFWQVFPCDSCVFMLQLVHKRLEPILIKIPYKNKYWQGTNFGELANRHTIAKFKYFFYSISIVTLVAFGRFHQINITPNPLFQQIAKYYICQYLFLYGIWTASSIFILRNLMLTVMVDD